VDSTSSNGAPSREVVGEHDVARIAGGRTKRKNFEAEEEVVLCQAYLRVGIDSEVGTSQAGTTFWGRVTAYYNANCPEGFDTRPLRSLETKWSTIQHEVSKFCGCVAKVQDLNRSGTNEEDDISTAKELYQNTHVTKGIRDFKPFKYLHCWRVLSKEPKWQSHRSSSRVSKQPVTASISTDREERPTGNKAVKTALKSTASMEQSQKRLAEATLMMAEASRKRARALEESNNYTLFTIRLEELDGDAQEYFRLRRAEVLSNMRSTNNENQPLNEEPVVPLALTSSDSNGPLQEEATVDVSDVVSGQRNNTRNPTDT
jgi:hypothetical protein